MTQTFDDVVITGSTDKIQLTVQATSNQDEPLQSWQALSGDELARVQPDGRFQSGSLAEAGATGDAQIEVFRHEDATSLPKRGLNITGAINDALNAVVSWSVHELFLRGTAGVKALHSALRVRLVNQTTGVTNTNGELRAGEFEVLNNGGDTSDRVPVATGLDVRLTNDTSGYIDSAYGVRVEVADLSTNGISNPYALHATGAKTRLDDVLELRGDRADGPPAEEQVAKIYVKSDGKLYARLESGDEYLLSSALVPESPEDDGKFLSSDGTWQAAGSGSGTVTSVGLTMPPEFIVSNSPVTGADILAVGKANQAANQIYSGPPSGVTPAVPEFRSLVNNDLPTVDAAHGGTGLTTLSANNLLSGNGTNQVNLIAPGPSGTYLRSNGTAFHSAGLNATDVSSGTLSAVTGGTGISSPTAGRLLVTGGPSAMTLLSPGSAGQVVRSNGSTFQSANIIPSDLPVEVFTGEGSTTSSAVDILFSRSLATNSAEMVWGQVMGVRDQFGQSLVARFHFIARRTTGNVNVSVQILNQQHDSGGSPSISIDVIATSWRILVTPPGTQTWKWWGSFATHAIT